MSEWLVVDALELLDEADQRRAMDQISALIADVRARPALYGDIEFEIRRAAMTRHIDGDVTAPVWVALWTSRDLAAEVACICHRAGVQ